MKTKNVKGDVKRHQISVNSSAFNLFRKFRIDRKTTNSKLLIDLMSLPCSKTDSKTIDFICKAAELAHLPLDQFVLESAVTGAKTLISRLESKSGKRLGAADDRLQEAWEKLLKAGITPTTSRLKCYADTGFTTADRWLQRFHPEVLK